MRLSRLVRSPRIVLGIETSCDDTGVALLTRLPSGEVKVLAQRVRPQWDLVSRFGGVFPDEAWRAHDAAIDGLLAEVLLEAKIESMSEIDSIAVTLGPGLAPCLIVGAKRAQQYSQRFNLPVVGVNHLHAHAMTPLLDGTGPKQAPFLAIILSGGHSMIVECRGDSNRPEDCIDPAKFRVLGKCLDDAMGEALDKGWRLLLESLEGCGSASDAERRREGHAAAALEVLAREAASTSDYEPFSVPMAKRVLGSDFSFSGLKAQLARRLRAHPPQTRQAAAHVAAAYQKAAIEHVVLQLSRATKQLREERPFDALPAVALVGGVAANEALRQRLTAAVAGSSELHFSPKALCGDNAVMVAFVGLLRREREAVEPPFGFDAGWPLGPHTRERSQLRQS